MHIFFLHLTYMYRPLFSCCALTIFDDNQLLAYCTVKLKHIIEHLVVKHCSVVLKPPYSNDMHVPLFLLFEMSVSQWWVDVSNVILWN
jgi:hypothetical protein